MKKCFCYLAAALALACTSCGKATYPVSGTVTYRGAPAAGAAVFFYRRGGDPMNEPMIMGIVQNDGSFSLDCGSLGKGAPAGEYAVLIEWKPASNTARKGRPQKRPDVLKGRYADLKLPRLHALVKTEANSLPPFELTDY